MQGFEVRIVDGSINLSGNRLITGIIYFEFGTFQFPESSWNDMIVVIVGWWLSALTSLVNGNASEACLRFMEGPYWISIRRDAADRWTARCIEERSSERVQFERHCSVPDLLKSMLSAAVRVHEICIQRGWQSKELEELERQITAARALVLK